MKKNENHIAIKVTETAKNNTFVDCKINGGVEMSGTGNKMIRTEINQFKKEHPLFFVIGFVVTIIGFISGVLDIIHYLK